MQEKLTKPFLTQLLADNKFRNQSEILAHLNAQGFHLSQSALSRRLSSIGITKHEGYYTLKAPAASFSKNNYSVIPVPPNLIVMKTPGGHAGALAAELDNHNWPGLQGTIAGDDTIFLATSQDSLSSLTEKLTAHYSQR